MSWCAATIIERMTSGFHLAMDWLLRWCNENGVAVPHFGINDHAWALILRPNKVARDRWPRSMLLVRIQGALADAFTLPGQE